MAQQPPKTLLRFVAPLDAVDSIEHRSVDDPPPAETPRPKVNQALTN